MFFIITFLSGIFFFYSFQYFPISSLLIVIASLLLLLRTSAYEKRKKHTILTLFFFFVAGLLFPLLHNQNIVEKEMPPQESILRGVFTSIPSKGEHLYRQQFLATYPHNFKGSKLQMYSYTPFTPGSEAMVTAFIKSYIPKRNPGSYYSISDIVGTIKEIHYIADSDSIRYFHERIRYKISKLLEKKFNDLTAGFLRSITIGDREGLSFDIREIFNNTGLAHLLSISGTHFGLLFLLTFGLIKRVIHLLPYPLLIRLSIYITPSALSAALSFPVITFYLLLSGMRTPTVRSYIMVTLFILGVLLGRKRVWLNTLLIAALIIELFQPNAFMTLSFQLSFVAVLFIGLFLEKRGDDFSEEKSGNLLDRSKMYLQTTFIITVAAFLGTLPLTMYGFHYIPLISPLANMIVVPFICFIVLPLTIGSLIVFLLTGFFPFSGAIFFLTEGTFYFVKLLSSIPYSSISIKAFPYIFIPLLYLCFTFFLMRRDKDKGDRTLACKLITNRKLIVAVTLLSFLLFHIYTKDNGLRVTFLDVGQGDASLIELSDGRTIGIDTGSSGREMEKLLKYRGETSIDLLFLSHAGDDHTGGVSHLLKTIKIGAIYDNGRLHYSRGLKKYFAHNSIEVKHLKRGDIIKTGNIKITVLHPYKGFYEYNDLSDNNSSLVLLLQGKHLKFLYAGDIEKKAEDDILYSIGNSISSQVLKVAHHGSKTSSTEEFINTVTPEYAIISAKKWNKHRHPHQETLDRLKNTKIYRTDRDGAIGFIEKQNGYEIKVYSYFKLKKAATIKEEFYNLKRLFTVW